MKEKHILIGKSLILNIDHIVSVNLSAKDDKDKDCIKVKLSDGVEWTVWANLQQSKRILESITNLSAQFELLESVKAIVNKNRIGRESNVSKEIRNAIYLNR